MLLVLLTSMSDSEAWKEYCEASRDLCELEEVSEDAPWLDCADGFKDLPDEDADLKAS